jgi:hypothetical protein
MLHPVNKELLKLMALSSGKAEERGVHVVLETSLLLVQLELCQQLLQRRDLQLHVPHLVVQVTTTSIVICSMGWTFSATIYCHLLQRRNRPMWYFR